MMVCCISLCEERHRMYISWKISVVVLLVIANGVLTSTTPTSPKPPTNNCGYKSCHPTKPGSINVHIVAHTHDDVGWLKTVDQYYYGSNSKIQQAGVQYILDTVIDSLRKDKTRKFIYVETAFFWKWWIKQHDIVKSRVRKLVKNGQLEFVSGGWSMNDEAVTHYQSIIDQMTWGLRKLNDTFGECGRPRVGWQIDPFGHSKEMTNIFAQLGFDGVLLGRIDYQDKEQRFKTKSPEMIWKGSSSLGQSSDIFTGVMFNTYSPPPGFCFDILCSDEPFIDDKKSFEYNVDQKVDEFLKYVDKVRNVYSTNNIIITMGNDFNYQDAEVWFANLDKLINYVNQRQNNGSIYNLLYSTPSCYIKAIYDENQNKKNWPTKTDDFFPYASDPNSFWTGYFTSRPAIKRYERIGNNFLQVCKQLYAIADLGPEDRIDLNALREGMGIMQHHDAITGTEKQHVAEDYARQLQRGMDECQIIVNAAMSKILNETVEVHTCPLLNVSQCHHTETRENFVVTLYNPLSRPVDRVVRIPVTGGSFNVNDLQGNDLKTQIIPIPDFIRNIPGRISVAKQELIFLANQIPALGWKSYQITQLKDDKVSKPEKSYKQSLKDTAFTIDPKTGLLNSIEINGISLPVNQNFYFYKGVVGNNEVNKQFTNRSSGAYIFRPQGLINTVTDKVEYQVYQGDIVAELHQTFNDYISQIIRVNSIDSFVEFDWVVGPLPLKGKNGMEVVTKFTTNLASESTFYTDSNGKEMLRRTRNFRPTWKLNLSEPVSGNYYPVTSKISVRDEQQGIELAVLNDRAQGGTSLKDGEVELMIHRNCFHDDSFGVDEILNETAFGKGLVVRGSHYLTVGKINENSGKSVAALTRDIAQRRLLDTWTFIFPVEKLPKKPEGLKYAMEFSGLTTTLPQNVQILTLEPWIGFSFLLRLEHVFEKDEDNVFSKAVVVKLKDLFTPFEIISVRETTLGANQWLEDSHRLNFTTSENEDFLYTDYVPLWEYQNGDQAWREQGLYKNEVKRETVIDFEDNIEAFEVVLSPSQIRTFIIEIKKK